MANDEATEEEAFLDELGGADCEFSWAEAGEKIALAIGRQLPMDSK